MNGLNQHDLDLAADVGCQNPQCQHKDHAKGEFFFHGRCHPGAPVQISYKRDSGILQIFCHACRRPIATIAVHPAPDHETKAQQN